MEKKRDRALSAQAAMKAILEWFSHVLGCIVIDALQDSTEEAKSLGRMRNISLDSDNKPFIKCEVLDNLDPTVTHIINIVKAAEAGTKACSKNYEEHREQSCCGMCIWRACCEAIEKKNATEGAMSR
jgi:hypothetical protein